MIDDAGVMIEKQRLQKERSALSKSAADFPYTGDLQIVSLWPHVDIKNT